MRVEMEGHSHIATDVLARYAADAAREVPGVTGLVGRHGGVRVEGDRLELHLAVGWGTSIEQVCEAVQRGVVEYLGHMADVHPAAVDVVVEEVA
jgi:uncharacterized alkaline shock family protein YloU